MPSARVLAIDDDGFHLVLLQQQLQEDGFEVLLAQNGPQGIELARTQVPDVILCDVFMPEFNGFQVLASLKSTSATAEIPVILMTVSPSGEDQQRALSAGASAYFHKEDGLTTLARRIEERLAGIRSLRHILEQQRGEQPGAPI